MLKFYIGRVVTVLTAATSLLLAVTPAVADLDPSSTAGVVAGIGGLVLIVRKWLDGLQQHEAREAVKRPKAV